MLHARVCLLPGLDSEFAKGSPKWQGERKIVEEEEDEGVEEREAR